MGFLHAVLKQQRSNFRMGPKGFQTTALLENLLAQLNLYHWFLNIGRANLYQGILAEKLEGCEFN